LHGIRIQWKEDQPIYLDYILQWHEALKGKSYERQDINMLTRSLLY